MPHTFWRGHYKLWHTAPWSTWCVHCFLLSQPTLSDCWWRRRRYGRSSHGTFLSLRCLTSHTRYTPSQATPSGASSVRDCSLFDQAFNRREHRVRCSTRGLVLRIARSSMKMSASTLGFRTGLFLAALLIVGIHGQALTKTQAVCSTGKTTKCLTFLHINDVSDRVDPAGLDFCACSDANAPCFGGRCLVF